MLKGKALGDPSVTARFRERFAGVGIGAERLELRSHAASTAEHLGMYREVDIALDPFPYNGTTTTCEALLMGVPVVALRGEVHAGRVGASLLGTMGRKEFIADSVVGYQKLAAGLASDLDRLEKMRNELRKELLASELCDGAGLARAIDGVLERAWQEWLAGAG